VQDAIRSPFSSDSSY